MRSLYSWCWTAAAGALALVIACGSDGSTGGGGSGDAGVDTGTGSTPPFGSSDAGDGGGDDEPATDVEAVVTSDNAFSFGYGSSSALGTYIRGEGSDGPAIFDCPVGYGPTAYTVPAAAAPRGAYLYIVAWADEQTTQGTLAQFKRVGGTKAIYSGSGEWEVCAVGTPFDHRGQGPDQAQVDAALGQCNAGAAGTTYSKGWVNTAGAVTEGALGRLAFGEANDDAGGAFPIVCQQNTDGGQGMDPEAKWMWFDPLDGEDPFVGNGGNRTKTFLVFRLPASAIPAAPVN